MSSFLPDQLGSLVTWAPAPARLPGTFAESGPRGVGPREGAGFREKMVRAEEAGDLADRPAAPSQPPLIAVPVKHQTLGGSRGPASTPLLGLWPLWRPRHQEQQPGPLSLPHPQPLQPGSPGSGPSSAAQLCDPGRVPPCLWGRQARWHSGSGRPCGGWTRTSLS